MACMLLSPKYQATIHILQEENIMSEKTRTFNLWDRIMMAITFAEADEAQTAREMLDINKVQQQRRELRTGKTKEQRPTLNV